MKLLITGGCGFIGSNAVNYFQRAGYDIVGIVDSMTYAANPNNLIFPATIYKHDIYSVNWPALLSQTGADVVIHMAEESHVDNANTDGTQFIKTNDAAVYRMLQGFVEFFAATKKKILFIQVSPDAVLGSISDEDKPLSEDAKLNPGNVYASSKAAAELLTQSMHNVHKDAFDYVIARATNNYGPNQHMEKLIPTVIKNAMLDQPVPVYGDGLQSREWLWVLDFINGLDLLLRKYAEKPEEVVNQIFHFGSNFAVKNLGLVKFILNRMQKPDSLIQMVDDRPGHDRRYSLNYFKATSVLGWQPKQDLGKGIDFVIENIKTRLLSAKNTSW
jgi:dTDP-glucose 4,6-dehydratase